MQGRSRAAAALVLLLLASALGAFAGASPAQAAARVSVSNPSGSAAIDPTYTTTLTLVGSGFQSIRKGHGGIYVLFAAVRGEWRPSRGGQTGRNYFSVPDSESKDNGGFAKFVSFPGSDTASSANGGTIGADGRWSTSINVPGATFRAVDRKGRVRTIDCRQDTCGVLTVGAHGVVNGSNETFTRVTVKDLYADGEEPPATTTTGTTTGTPAGGAATTTASGPADGGAPAVAAQAVGGPARLEVDRASARPGRVLAFSASGLVPGSQVSATFENGWAGAGPLTVGSTGQVAGLLPLPADVGSGTYELRLVGDGELPSVRFAVVADTVAEDEHATAAWVFAGVGAAVLLAALLFAALRWRGVRRAG